MSEFESEKVRDSLGVRCIKTLKGSWLRADRKLFDRSGPLDASFLGNERNKAAITSLLFKLLTDTLDTLGGEDAATVDALRRILADLFSSKKLISISPLLERLADVAVRTLDVHESRSMKRIMAVSVGLETANLALDAAFKRAARDLDFCAAARAEGHVHAWDFDVHAGLLWQPAE
jgi:hypothetical protein